MSQRSATLKCESPLLRVLARLLTIPRTTYSLRHQRYIKHQAAIRCAPSAHRSRRRSHNHNTEARREMVDRLAASRRLRRRRRLHYLQVLPRVSSCLFTVEGAAQLCKHILCCEVMKKMPVVCKVHCKLQFLTCDKKNIFFCKFWPL
jgi:hypothetical protein